MARTITTGTAKNPTTQLSAPAQNRVVEVPKRVLEDLVSVDPRLLVNKTPTGFSLALVSADELGPAPLPADAVILRATGDATGAKDNLALRTIVEAGGTAVMESAKDFFDDGTIMNWHPLARVLTTDGRAANWKKGSLATTQMNAIPGCVNSTSSVLTMRLAPGVNWAEQLTTCMITIAATLTVAAPVGHTLGEIVTTMQTGGANSRLVILSQGTTVLVPVAEGPPQSYGLIAETIRSPYIDLSLTPGKLANDGTQELGNFAFIFGAQRGPGFTQGTAIFFKFAPTGANLVDIQTFGSGSASGVSYVRWGHSIGRREQQTGINAPWIIQPQASGAHIIIELGAGTATDFYVTAAGAVGAVQNLFIDGDGSTVLAAVATQELELRSGATKRIEINGTGIGVFGVVPVARPSVSASSPTLAADILVALNALGWVLQIA